MSTRLRRYRDAAGLTIEQVAEALDCSTSKISRIETGQIGVSIRDVREMLLLYGVSEAELEGLMEMARQTRQQGWWQPYGSVLTSAYVGFEAAAKSIRSYEAQCVPGLLQTEEYARSLIQGARPNLSPEDVSSRVKVRMERQALLMEDEPVELWCVLDEAVLLRPVGGRDVMRRQLERLVALAVLPNVTLQVLPLDAGAHPGMEGSFAVLGFPDEADPDTVYVEMATGGVIRDKPDDVARYKAIFDCLQALALSPDESAELVARTAEERHHR